MSKLCDTPLHMENFFQDFSIFDSQQLFRLFFFQKRTVFARFTAENFSPLLILMKQKHPPPTPSRCSKCSKFSPHHFHGERNYQTRRERLKSAPYLRLKRLKDFKIVKEGPFGEKFSIKMSHKAEKGAGKVP